jgi:hypothetical protein
MQTIRRSKKDSDNPYKSIRRATFEDNRLSFEARGVLGYILVKPDDWRINVTDLMKQGDMGRDKTYRILNELIETGYCERVELRDRGRIVGYDYLINEEPCTEKPLPDFPYTAKPLTENQDHTNKEVPLKKKETKEEVAGKQQHPWKAILDAYVKWKDANQPGCIINYPAETKAAKAIAQQNWTPDQVVQCCNILHADTFYQSSSLSLWTVGKQIGAKVKRGSVNSAAAPVIAPDWMTYQISEDNQWTGH